jgi:hypothetical protein
LYKVYKQRVEDEFKRVKEKKCGIAFLTCSTIEQAYKYVSIFVLLLDIMNFFGRIRSDFRPTCFVRDHRQETSTSKTLGIHEWTVKFAPNPKNIIW